MQNIKDGHTSVSSITGYKDQRANVKILEKADESVGVSKGSTRGFPDVVNGVHQTDQVVGGRFVRRARIHEEPHGYNDVSGEEGGILYITQTEAKYEDIN